MGMGVGRRLGGNIGLYDGVSVGMRVGSANGPSAGRVVGVPVCPGVGLRVGPAVNEHGISLRFHATAWCMFPGRGSYSALLHQTATRQE